MSSHFFSRYKLELNPIRFTQNRKRLSFEHREDLVVIYNPSALLNEQNAMLCSIPWFAFGVFDCSLHPKTTKHYYRPPNEKTESTSKQDQIPQDSKEDQGTASTTNNNALTNCATLDDIDVDGDSMRNVVYDMAELIHYVLPYLHSINVSSTTKRKKDVVYWSDDLFPNATSGDDDDNNVEQKKNGIVQSPERLKWNEENEIENVKEMKRCRKVIHASINGKFEHERYFAEGNNDETKQEQKQIQKEEKQDKDDPMVFPGLNMLFRNKFNQVMFLELNNIEYPDREWIQPIIDELPQLIVLDLFRSLWKQGTTMQFPAGLEVFRAFACTVDCNFDFTTCKHLRAVCLDEKQILMNKSSLQHLTNVMKNVGVDKLALVIGHLHTNNCKKVLFTLYCNGIKKVYIPETGDLRDFGGMKTMIEEERNRRMTFKDYTAVKLNAAGGDDNNHEIKENETSSSESTFAHEQNDSYWLNEMTIIYSRIPVSIYAASQHYSTYRKLHRIGRLRGNLLWEDANSNLKEAQKKTSSLHDKSIQMKTSIVSGLATSPQT